MGYLNFNKSHRERAKIFNKYTNFEQTLSFVGASRPKVEASSLSRMQ